MVLRICLLAAAEAPAGYESVVRAGAEDDPHAAQRRLDAKTPGFATAIDVAVESGSVPADGLSELVARTPGASVQSMGGLGQFSSLSLRGSSGQQVAYFLDGAPLGGGLGGLLSLSELPLDTLERIEIYRGFVPISFGGATIGGAVNLVGARHEGPARAQVTSGIGSFGARELRGAWAQELGEAQSLQARLGYSGASGDFAFHDDGGTPLERSDDGTARRLGNDYERLLGQLRLDGSSGAWRWSAQQVALYKEQGVPGPATAQASSARLGTVDLRSVLSLGRSEGGRRASLVGSVAWQQRDFGDPENELGVPLDDNVTRTVDLYLSPRWRVPLWAGAFASLVADGRYEDTRVDALAEPTGPQQTTGDARRWRASLGGGIGLEQFLFAGRWLLAPALRLDVADNHFAVAPGEGEVEDRGADVRQSGLSPRLGSELRLLDWLELRASAGRYFRAPTLLELFAKEGYAVGNEGLEPERGTSVDAGLVIDLPAGLYAQLAGFATWTEQLIQWFQIGPAVRPENVPGAFQAGVEAGLSAHAFARRLRTQGSYTYLFSENRSPEAEQTGKRLPGRPAHDLFLRASAGTPLELWGARGTPRLAYSFEYIAGTFLDPSGRRAVPARALHGLGLELWAAPIRLSAQVHNLFDLRTTSWRPPIVGGATYVVPASDAIGYPLPGRSFWLSLAVDLGGRDLEDPS